MQVVVTEALLTSIMRVFKHAAGKTEGTVHAHLVGGQTGSGTDLSVVLSEFCVRQVGASQTSWHSLTTIASS